MSAPGILRKGWCPGALRPMAARDGLLVRLRPTGGIVPAATALDLADLAETYGNGSFDLTARANLQMRGVGETALPDLLGALGGLGLLDADPAGESVRNVLASPLAGLGTDPDIRPTVAALEARLAGDPALHALPSKFGFLVDDGGTPTLAGIAADVRFDWCVAEGAFAVSLGGTRASALPAGMCTGADLAEQAARIAKGYLRLAADHPEARRMRSLRQLAGDAAVARACGTRSAGPLVPAGNTQAQDVVGARTFAGTPVLGLAAPFGRLSGDMLRAAAHLCLRSAQGKLSELRLTPWRTILVPASPRHSTARAAGAGWIVDPADPRLRVAACTGREGCERGTTDTHADATALAVVAAGIGSGVTLHVSGCAKGCARPAATRVTLVGCDGRYDLVRAGTAGDPPERRGLTLAACLAALDAAAVEPA